MPKLTIIKVDLSTSPKSQYMLTTMARPSHVRRRPITKATVAGALSLIAPAASLLRMYARTSSLFPIAYTCVMSGVTFLFYGYDKMQARDLNWRVKEVTLLGLGFVGGWPGALAGQHFFQHKTTKTSFLVPFWGIIVWWQVMLWVFLYESEGAYV